MSILSPRPSPAITRAATPESGGEAGGRDGGGAGGGKLACKVGWNTTPARATNSTTVKATAAAALVVPVGIVLVGWAGAEAGAGAGAEAGAGAGAGLFSIAISASSASSPSSRSRPGGRRSSLSTTSVLMTQSTTSLPKLSPTTATTEGVGASSDLFLRTAAKCARNVSSIFNAARTCGRVPIMPSSAESSGAEANTGDLGGGEGSGDLGGDDFGDA